MWSGIKGKSWTTALRDIVTTGQTPSGTQYPLAGITNSSAVASAGLVTASQEETAVTGADAQQNEAIAKVLALPYGWSTGTQWNDLVALWNRESGWSNTAENGSSGAYGIPQALPYTKMPQAAWPASAGGSSSASAQIQWGLQYIKDTYGNPANAWAHEESAGWY